MSVFAGFIRVGRVEKYIGLSLSLITLCHGNVYTIEIKLQN